MKILAIDGGGIRGIIPALVLAAIEARTDRPIAASFDLIAGTSTGGIIACALARPGAPHPSQVVRIYEDEGPSIFHRDLLKRIVSLDGNVDERYDNDGLKAALAKHLGDATLSQATTDVMVTAYDLEDRFAFFFRSSRARTDPTYDFRMTDVALATSAAPTYFEPAVVTDVAGSRSYGLVDGGVFATNPAMCALADALDPREVELLVSLGTGEHTRPILASDAAGWGRLEWASRIVDVVFDGVAETVDFEASRLLGDRYIRLQTPLGRASDDLDDASPGNLRALRETGEELVRSSAAELDRIAAILTAGQSATT
jgi:patatin-like phospholipase/acyl hydrolase